MLVGRTDRKAETGGEVGMTDMYKQEQCISYLEQQISWIEDIKAHQFPGWGHTVNAMRQAIALLKAQEPHLLAEGDFIDNPRCDRNGCLPVWVEYRTGHCGWTKTSAETMYVGMFSRGRQKYRYWTDKPTMEQMEATPWER